MATLQAIKYTRGRLDVLDQLRLPHESHYDEVSNCEEAFDCIKAMRVRGAPAIAIVAALALAVELHRGACSTFCLKPPDLTNAFTVSLITQCFLHQKLENTQLTLSIRSHNRQ